VDPQVEAEARKSERDDLMDQRELLQDQIDRIGKQSKNWADATGATRELRGQLYQVESKLGLAPAMPPGSLPYNYGMSSNYGLNKRAGLPWVAWSPAKKNSGQVNTAGKKNGAKNVTLSPGVNTTIVKSILSSATNYKKGDEQKVANDIRTVLTSQGMSAYQAKSMTQQYMSKYFWPNVNKQAKS
jgi:hypothetical protein